MMDYYLPAEELAELRAAHRSTRDKREADRIKAVVLLASDWGQTMSPMPCWSTPIQCAIISRLIGQEGCRVWCIWPTAAATVS